MSKRLATIIMQTFVFAALILTGWGVQASQAMPVERVQLQEHSMNADSDMNMNTRDMTSMSGMAMDGECSPADCDMDMKECHSACGGCPAVNAGGFSAHAPNASADASNPVLAAMAVQYPIDHPPKQ